MNLKPASFSKENIFKEKLISFSDLPGQSKLFVDYQNNTGALTEFYPNKSKNLKDFSFEVKNNYKIDRKRLCNILKKENEFYRAGEKTFESISKLESEDCFAILTGQQAGLFSGPIYSVYKALSAIKFAESLSKKGIKAVPIFWIASEDHDFDEIKETSLINQDNKKFTIQNSPEGKVDNLPVGFIQIEPNINESLHRLLRDLTQTNFTKGIENLLRHSYKAQESYSSAFGKLLAKIFADFGLIFVSPLNKDLRSLSTEIVINAIDSSKQITEKLLIRNEELVEKDYHSQVHVEKDFFPFFFINDEKERKPLRLDIKNSKIKSIDKEYEFTFDELKQIATDSPQKLSPNALMRPIVQDNIFPTLTYFGGGAEIAYFGQNSVIYELLDRPVTPIRHRSSFTIIEGKHRRSMDKYNLSFSDLFKGKEEILAEIVEQYLNSETSKVFAETEETINSQLNQLDNLLAEDAPTLSDNSANRRKKILWHIAALRKKFHKAEIDKNEVIHRRINDLFGTVLPNDSLQERTLNVLHFINLFGENFIDWIYKATNADIEEHQLIIF